MLDTTQPQRYNAYDRPHEDLREFVERAEGAGELMRVPGASPELEMGTLAEIVYHARPEPPAIVRRPGGRAGAHAGIRTRGSADLA